MTPTNRNNRPNQSTVYEINVQGQIDESWSGWFTGLSICSRNGNPPLTTLVGPVIDQVALRAILNRIWDLNLDLISVNLVSAEHTHNEQEASYHNREAANGLAQESVCKRQTCTIKEVYDV